MIRALIWILDFLAIGTLFLTNELHPAYFAWAALAAITLRFLPKRLPDRALIFLMIPVLVGEAAHWIYLKQPPILSAAGALILVQTLFWFAQNTPRNRNWRIGMGFAELILCSGLTTELYLSLAIFGFVVTASVALSCHYLETSLSNHRERVIPNSFIRSSLGLSLLIFMTSAFIFPILPRQHGSWERFAGQFAPPKTEVGYTEQVQVGQSKTLDGSNGIVLVRYYFDSNQDLLSQIYLGLIRSRVLSRFDGKNWLPSVSGSAHTAKPDVSSSGDRIEIDAVREPVETPAIPAPYGARGLTMQGAYGENWKIRLNGSGEWIEPIAMNRRISYHFSLFAREAFYLKSSDDFSSPTTNERFVPKQFLIPRFTDLRKKIFKPGASPQEKIRQLMAYYDRENFAANPEGQPTVPSGSTGNLSPIERFLFVDRSGHCELFSSATAILLRMEGVPTRLVAGFRISSSPVGGVLTVRSGDAHAWVEAFIEGKGWIPLDPTPRLSGAASVLKNLQAAYDVMSAYWYRYVLRNDSGTQLGFNLDQMKFQGPGSAPLNQVSQFTAQTLLDPLKQNWRVSLAAMLIAAAVIAFGAWLAWRWYPQLFSIRWRVRFGPPALRRRRIRVEQALARFSPQSSDLDLHQLQKVLAPEVAHALAEWNQRYEELRFSAHPDLNLEELDQAEGALHTQISLASKRESVAS